MTAATQKFIGGPLDGQEVNADGYTPSRIFVALDSNGRQARMGDRIAAVATYVPTYRGYEHKSTERTA